MMLVLTVNQQLYDTDEKLSQYISDLVRSLATIQKQVVAGEVIEDMTDNERDALCALDFDALHMQFLRKDGQLLLLLFSDVAERDAFVAS